MFHENHKLPHSLSSIIWCFFITARVRSTTGRYCFHRCLSVHRGGGGSGYPSPGGGGGPGTTPRGGGYLTGYPPGGGVPR